MRAYVRAERHGVGCRAVADRPIEFAVLLHQAEEERWMRRMVWHPGEIGLSEIVYFGSREQVKKRLHGLSRIVTQFGLKLRAQQQQWDHLAAADPFWAILSDPQKRHGNWDP